MTDNAKPAKKGGGIEVVMQALNLERASIFNLQRDGVVVKWPDGSYDIFKSMANYIKWLQPRAKGRPNSNTDGSLSERDQAQVDNLRAKTELANIEIDTLKGQLIPLNDVVSTCVAIIKPAADMLSDLPDTIERVTGAGAEVITAIGKVIDEQRLVMFERLDSVVNGRMESYGSASKDDDVDEEPAKEEKPKKVKAVK